MFTLRDVAKEFISNGNVDDFMLWAFGDDVTDILISELPKKWNKKHGHLYKIKSDSSIVMDLIKMVELWESR